METKRFTVVDTRSNSTVVFESLATTVAELKADLMAHNINYEGMSIQEGLTKTELLNDDSLLPHDVPYHGSVTNNLVFRLTQANRNVKSGMNRAEAYKAIADLGLADIIKDKYGKNYTLVKTDILIDEVENARDNEEEECEYYDECENTHETTPLERLVEVLANKHILEDAYVRYILGTDNPAEGSLPYSHNEIDKMFADM